MIEILAGALIGFGLASAGVLLLELRRERRNVERDRARLARALESDTRSCTCHPDDNPPVPCPRRYAYSECRREALKAGGPR